MKIHIEKNTKKIHCCFCGKLIDFRESNNPYPISVKGGGRCCDDCDMGIVLPLRVELKDLALERQLRERQLRTLEMKQLENGRRRIEND